MIHWNLEPIEREGAHGVPNGTFRMVASLEGARGGIDCCDHAHTSPDEALLCAEAVHNAKSIVGDVPMKRPGLDALADAAKIAHGRTGGNWHQVARTVAARLGHVAMAALLAVVIGADETACSAARETPVDLSSTLPPRAYCTPGSWRCNDRIPEMCGVSRDGVTRWGPTTQPARDGTPARCAVCVVDARAHCVDARLLDAGADASDASEAGQ